VGEEVEHLEVVPCRRCAERSKDVRCLSLGLLEGDIQHVRLNVVWVGVDGRCAELGRDVQ
jgi:hypothetical protein